jgi:probable HAF family extracellular repeat protein
MNNASQVNDNHGWYKLHGQFFAADFPTTSLANPPVDQLLGVNDKDQAVGFFTDATAINHGYEFDISSGQYKEITVSGFSNVTTSGINNQGDIVGFGTASDGNTHGFLLTNGGSKVTELSYPGAASTQPLGVNNNDEVVGVATVGSDNSAKMYGFTYYPAYGFKTINAPAGKGTTTINGVNACGDLVGFYVDGAGNTDGLLANAQFSPTASSANASAARAGKKAKKGKTKKVKTVLPKGC